MLLDCLAEDFTRLRRSGERDPSAPVPTCPEWTVDDLVRHVGEVYLHKVECMRRGTFPDPWPPDTSGEPALHLLDRGYAALSAEFAARPPGSPAATWFEPEQTVGFWIRRMAQETVIHRVDGELALGEEPGPIPDDLAVDGIDEVLERFLRYGSHRWVADFRPTLPGAEQPPVLVATDGYGWLVRATPDGVAVEIATPRTAAPATVSGDPVPLLLWLWRRADGGVETDGDPALIANLRSLLFTATQ